MGRTNQVEGLENVPDRLKAHCGVPVMMKVLLAYQIDYRPVGHYSQTESFVCILFMIIILVLYWVGILGELTKLLAYSFVLCFSYLK